MREVGCVGLSDYAAQLKCEKNQLCASIKEASKDQPRELLLEYAEKCEALGHWYRQKDWEIACKK